MFVASQLANQPLASRVLRYNGTTGAYEGVFASGGALSFPYGLAFSPSGDLLVDSSGTNQVLRYNGTTGAFEGVFASAGLNAPVPLLVGPGGDLFVGNYQYEPSASVQAGPPAPPRASSPPPVGLNGPYDMTSGTGGDLFVIGTAVNQVLRYSGTTGAFEGVFASGGGLNGPDGLAFAPDGDLLVSSHNTDQILRYNGTTGAFEGVFASGGSLNGPEFLLFTPDAVPEPSSLVLCGIAGLTGLGYAWRRRKLASAA